MPEAVYGECEKNLVNGFEFGGANLFFAAPMSLENKIEELAGTVAASKFKWNYADAEYKWLALKCLELVELLKQFKAEPVLIKKLADIGRDLEEQNKYLTHDLLRQRTLVFHQDAIIFYLMKEGYIKLLPF